MATDDFGEEGGARPQWSWLARFTVRRAIADRSLLAPALFTCLVTTTLLAAAPILTQALSTAGLRGALTGARTTDRDLRISSTVDGAPPRELDAAARRGIAQATAPVGAAVHRQLRSGTYALEGADALAEFAWIDDADRLAYSDGRPPGGGDEVAVPRAVADALGLATGDTVAATGTTSDAGVRLTVSGIYDVTAPQAVRWWGAAPVPGTDWERGGFTIYGPLLVARATLVDVLGVEDAWWTAALRTDRLDDAAAGRIRRQVRAFAARTDDDLRVDTDLPTLLADVGQRQLAARAGVLTVVLQVLLLAVYGLTLAARLIIAQRVDATALLRSRGAGGGQLAAVTLAEAALVVLPGVLVAPALARVLVGLVDERGVLAAAGLVLDPTVTPAAVAMAWIGGGVALAALGLPSVVAVGRPAAGRASARRQRTAGLPQRAGIDLVLVGIAALGYWQLRRGAGPLTTSVRGALGIDPLLVAAPTLCLLAGSVVALRAIPLLARVGERIAGAGRSLVPALSAWQIARRPRTYARAALLPLLALALGVFALAYDQTREAAQTARAVDRVNADLRVTPGPTTDVVAHELASAYRGIDGVTGLSPLVTERTPVSRAAGALGVVAVDARAADALAVDPSLASTIAALAATRPDLPSVRLPAARTARFEATIRETVGDGDIELVGRATPRPRLDLAVRDGDGLVHMVEAGEIPADGTSHALSVDVGGIAQPAAVVGLDLTFPPDLYAERYRYDIDLVLPADLRSTVPWQPVADAFRPRRIPRLPRIDVDGTRVHIPLRLEPGQAPADEVVLHLRPGVPAEPSPVDVIFDRRLSATLGVGVDDPVTLRIASTTVSARVVRVVPALPGLPEQATAGGALVDLGTLAALTFDQTQRAVEPTAWLLDVDGDSAAVARRLRTAPFASTEVLQRVQIAARQRTDPVALGVTGSLTLGFAAATVLAAVGFVVAAVASLRDRLTEFALLRAIGLSAGQLASWLTVEHATVLAGALAGGVVLGGTTARLILPYATLDATGGRPPGGVTVQVDLLAVAALVAVVVAAVGLIMLLLARPVRRLRVGEALRAGDDR